MRHHLVIFFALPLLSLTLLGCPDETPTGDGDGDQSDIDEPQNLEDPEGVAPGPVEVLTLGVVEPTSVGEFRTSKMCAQCHSNSPQATAMRDEAGNALAPYNLWQGTMMANAARDPFWRAMVSAEMMRTPDAGDAIVDKCMRCHTPMASETARAENLLASLPMLTGARGESIEQVALDGVSCTVCHQIRPENLGTEESMSGGFVINDEDIIWGPHENPAPGPMMNHVQKVPTYGTHVLKPELCSTCHTLSTPSLDEDGEATGSFFLEQSPYLEWQNSEFASEGENGITCQDCHMPTLDDEGNIIETRIARSPPGPDFLINERQPFGRHLFVGANTVVPEILKQNRSVLNPLAHNLAFDRAIELATKRLSEQSAELTLSGVTLTDEALSFDVEIVNSVGHKLPTGFPSRRVWLRARVLDEGGNVLFETGGFNEQGRIVNMDGDILDVEKAGGPIAPHRDIVKKSSQVQIYEQIMAGPDGEPTWSLMRASAHYKDNRLLPQGASSDHPNWERTRPVGVEEADFAGGIDTVHFELDSLEGTPARVEVSLHYQGLGSRFIRELYQVDTPEVQAFRTMLEGVSNAPVTMAEAAADL